ncbi:MAG: SDR family NAD(P)-dependent oxidoreductase [Gemmatimonadota bacterium]
MTIRSVLITGANAGLGREAARQLAQRPEIEKIYLACRNAAKARLAKSELEAESGRRIFDVVLMDVSDPASVRDAVAGLAGRIDGIVLNAGGMGGHDSFAQVPAGVTSIFAANVLGHAVLIDELLARDLAPSTVLYAGSEAARGIPRMGVPRPELQTMSVDEFVSIAEGSAFAPRTDPMVAYAHVKLFGALWMASLARSHPSIRFVTMSPGGTTGTNGMDDLPFLKRLMFKHVGGALMPLFGMMHGLDVGARRYVDALLDSRFESGHFYASTAGSPTGRVIDQAELWDLFSSPAAQDNAARALERFTRHATHSPTSLEGVA